MLTIPRSEAPDPIEDMTFLKGSAGVLALVSVYEGTVAELKDQAVKAVNELLHMGKLFKALALNAPLGLIDG